ncbi:MAG: glycosyltransferase [Chthoniobacterales bacterium]|nr:glycosyltransferase [Chthoniobacterales bacterium]
MLTRLLRVCGLHLGAEADLMPARPDNPDGFWENLRFVTVNDELLSALGGAWDLPPRPTENFGEACLDPLRTEAASLVEEFSSERAWGWKDPRNSLTLPFWKSLLPKLKTIVIVRNPLEVAYSMRERNGTSYAFGLRMWEIYNRRIVESTTAEERLLTHYDFFFENAESELGRLIAFIGLPASETAKAASLVAVDRRHTHFTIEQMREARVSAEIIDFYRGLVAEATPTAQTLGADIACVPGKDGEVGPSPISLATKSLDIDFLPGAVSRLDASRPEREANLRDATLERARRERDSSRAEVDLLSAKFANSEEEKEKLRDRFVQTNQLLRSTSVSLGESETRNATLTQQLRSQLQATKKLLRFLQDADHAADRLRQSRRWRMSNPFAWLESLFSTKPLAGFGHLDKVVDRFHEWRAKHPEAEKVDDALLALATGRAAKAEPSHSMTPPPPVWPIEFPVEDEVEVSIVIPVFNQVRFTEACLASVQQYHDRVSLEVIVVDDCSTDTTVEVLGKIPGLVFLRNETNAGFIASCNRGAKNAHGRYLLFLNNDTVVTPGWLIRLRETFDFEPQAGLVGSKLVYPDGRLQEAGGIIWRDATGWNRGKFQDSAKPEYNFLREVDYCSAASVMIPRAFFLTLGGFDSKYAPAYYEDTDLAFKVRAAGKKVLYQPLSKVIHYEGVTGGTDISAGTKKYQESNRATFAATWETELAEKPANGNLAAWEALKPGQKRVLVIDHHLPMPDRDSGSLRMFEILTILYHLGHRVTFLPDNLADIHPYGDNLKQRGIEVVYYPYAKSARDFLQTRGPEYDVVILSRCDFARKHVDNVRQYAPQSRLIFDTVDLHFVRTDREAELTKDPEVREQAREKEEAEYKLIDQADETWVVSSTEQELLARKRPGKPIHVVSNIVETPGSATPFSARQDFLFIGSFQHTPNIDAVLYFARDIYPLVRHNLSAAKFFIIGDKAPPSVVALADENTIVTGLAPDVRPYFDSVKLSIAPLRYGAGVKGKINQSMGLGVPVVATSLAVEGMGLTNREDVLIADEPSEFAGALLELYKTPALWDQLSQAGVSKTEASFSRETAERQLRRLFSDDRDHNSSRGRSVVSDSRLVESLASV